MLLNNRNKTLLDKQKMINYIGENLQAIGDIIIQTKRDIMELLLNFHNIFNKDKNKKNLSNLKILGCTLFLLFSHNYNGTSKGVS